MNKKNLSAVVGLVAAAAVLYLFTIRGIRFFLVPSASMEPTLMESDYIGGFEINPSDLKHGDIVVFDEKQGDFYVKRVIGLPGETLAIVYGVVFINGQALDEPYVQNHSNDFLPPLKIPDDNVFLMGDNRSNSTDSRRFGPVPVRQITVKVSFIYNPISRIGRVK